MPWDVLTDEQRELRELVRSLARERIAPRAAEIDESHEFPWDVVELFREHELFGLLFDEEWGGTGTGTLLALVAIEEVSKVCATSGLILAVAGARLARAEAGRHARAAGALPAEARLGRVAVRLRADRGGLGLRLARRCGRPRGARATSTCSTAASASSRTPASRTCTPSSRRPIRRRATPGSRRFVVESDAPGFEVARLEPKMGISGSTTGELVFDGCRVPAANLLGAEGEGFRIAMRILDRSRPGVAAQGLGIAQGATDYALEYAKTRETMGKPIAQHQLIAAKLADMETKCEAARGLLYRFGRMVDEGAPDEELTKASAMAKLYCTDVAMEVTTEAVQVLGGYGYIKEYPVERMMRDAKITQLYEGTNEIQRLVIAREMLEEQRAFLLAGVA